MENASKALLMAGGILIALLVIGALLLMFNQIGSYEKAQTTNEKSSQLAQFNAEFEKYLDDSGISGADLVSLANKVIDYNKKTGVLNSVNYDIKITLEVDMTGFRQKYVYGNDNNALFKSNIYTIDSGNSKNDLKDALDRFNSTDMELLKKVSSLYDKDNERESEEKIKKALKEIDNDTYKSWNFKSAITPTKDQIQNYKEYSEFKTSKFIINKNAQYKDGQIWYLSFKFKE